jgi:hypothetical protein
MNSQTCLTRAELEFAELRLRDVLVEDFRTASKSDAMSLDRILIHVVNMNEAISTAPESHDNVAKRLDDFAGMTARMATRNPASAAKLTRLSEALRAVSSRLRDKLSNVNLSRTKVALSQIKTQHHENEPRVQQRDTEHHGDAGNSGDGRVLEKLVHRVYEPLVAFSHSGRCLHKPRQQHHQENPAIVPA